MQEILVAGATGKLGSQITKLLLNRGSPVRLLARNADKARMLFEEIAIIFNGDIRKPESLVTPMKGVKIIICAVGSSSPIGANSPQHVDYEGVENLVEAARKEQVEHFVLVSSCAVTKPNHPLNAFGKVLSWKLRGEILCAKAGWFIPLYARGGLTNEPGGRLLLQAGQGDQISGMISREDVARVCIEALEFPSARNVTFEIIQSPKEGSVIWEELFAGLKLDE